MLIKSTYFRYAVALPVLIIVILCNTSIDIQATDKNNGKKTIQHKGNEIAFGEHKVYPSNYASYLREQQRLSYFAILPDSIPYIDPNTGEKYYKAVPKTIIPVSINGKPIYGREIQYNLYKEQERFTDPVLKDKQETLEHYLFTELQPTLSQLKDGFYNFDITQLVINEYGKIAYYNKASIKQNRGEWDDVIEIDNNIKQTVEQKMNALLQQPLTFEPATKQGTPVNVRLSLNNFVVEVKGQTATLIQRGC